MSRTRATALLGLVDSDEEASDILTSAALSTAKMAPAKKTRGTIANQVKATPQATTRQTSGRAAAATAAASTAKASVRKALAEKPVNVQEKLTRGKGNKRPAPEDVVSVDEEEPVGGDDKPKRGRGRPRVAKAPRISDIEDVSAIDQLQPTTRPPAKRGRKPKSNIETPDIEREIPETQFIETTKVSVDEFEEIEDLPPRARRGFSSAQGTRTHHVFSASRRAAPASDSELHDPSMRRRLGDLNRKYEILEAKYRDLREIGVKEAERNYDRLKKQGEERANTANQLIATLKAQLSAQTELAKESQRLRQQLEASQGKIEQLLNKVNSTDASLSEAKTEIKTLSTKLAAARSAETASTKIPGSAIKGSSANNRLLANAEAAAQLAQLKEVLYGDLTGLIVRGVKREEGIETYDCIQTGRNGTLHFKLAVGGEELTENFDEPQFMYLPQLDPSRDEELIDMLPDYLVEEIVFPQSHAARFYARVMKALTERLD
ncbi:chromosome segregation protein Csm1/Pcs1-domain-containing protein [Durotheca rogersii]|uniref:chromosome segregation protein Csm1/Pcs1-domain-containing protein n=1 Tax=Durotheca rogersii TaxID=419775 RepID=UPI00221E5F3E|nr:chromosome segregation protein Csm1/Pcs1-domain-containing protein [Durotheca rogersii]KAI5868610.1 chromosome segregation protein Csm1/Pcs1-domain-containing protein [Durotheca rogersii]